MSGFQNTKAQDLRRPFPGCIGRMINLFDLSAGMTGKKMLTEKAHGDGSPVQRKPDIKNSDIPSGNKIDNRQIVGDLKQKQNYSSKNSGGTPMKMLIAHEMSKETECKKPTNVVARLMGLEDDLTAQPYTSASQRKLPENLPQTFIGEHRGSSQQDLHFNYAVPCEISRPDHRKMQQRDTYEVWQQPAQGRKEKCEDNQNGLRMALVRQKFMEAKRLATDEKLLQSKEFQDALEVLSSNRDLFLKFLEEPNSVFRKQLNNLCPVGRSSQTRHITVLKPSKNIELKPDKAVSEHDYTDNDKCGWKTNNCHSNSQPTKIIVLKPSTSKNTKGPLSTITRKHLVKREIYVDPMDNEALHSGYIRNERAQRLEKTLNGHRRDESLLSSMFSNGYGGDSSSFNLSEIDYNEEEGGRFSDSEVELVTPTSHHSWDRFGSPCSLSSFSRVSHSPESSVIREARKRLSERWALMTCHGVSQEQAHMLRSSSTLGEMLAIPEVKREGPASGFTVPNSRSCGGEDELRSAAFCLSVGRTTNSGELLPGNLLRSKSVPASSAAFGGIELKNEDSGSQISMCSVSEVSKTKNRKLSFKEKVSDFFFSKSKKNNRERFVSSALVEDADTVVARISEMENLVNSTPAVDSQVDSDKKSLSATSPLSSTNEPKKATVSLEQPRTCDKSNELEKGVQHQILITNLDQPSPTSILDAPFEDDVNENFCQLSEDNTRQEALSRASPIESVARSLSWNDTHLETASPVRSNLYRTLSKAGDDGQDYFVFIQKLLSCAGLEKSDMIFAGWHSLDSPLDPILLDNFLDLKEDESKCIEKRSNLRLLFDCVNTALLELSWTTLVSARSWNREAHGAKINAPACSSLADRVWGLVINLFSDNQKLVCAEIDYSIMVDTALKKEIGGNSWAELIMIQVEDITKDVSGELLKDLVGEALADLAAACLC